MRLFLNIFRKIVIFLFITGVVFSNLPYNFISEYIDYYRDGANVVDNMWKLRNDDNVVDNFSTLNQIAQNLKVKEAEAANAGQMVLYFHKEASDYNQLYNSLNWAPPEPAADTASGVTSTVNVNANPPTALCESADINIANQGNYNKIGSSGAAAAVRCLASFISPPVGQAFSIATGDAVITPVMWIQDGAATGTSTTYLYFYKLCAAAGGDCAAAGSLVRFETATSTTDPGTTITAAAITASAPDVATSFAAGDRIAAVVARADSTTTAMYILVDNTARTGGNISRVTIKYTAVTPNKPVLTDAKSDDFTAGAATTACTTGGVAYNTKWTCLQGTAASTAGAFNNGNAAGTTGDSTDWLWLRNQTTATSAVPSNFGATPSNTFLYQTLNAGYGDGTVRAAVNSSATYTVGATAPTAPWNHSGLVLWTSNTDYVEVQVNSTAQTDAASTGTVQVTLNNCTSGCTGNNGTLTNVSLNPSATSGVFHRVWIGFSKTGTNYQAQYSTDGTTWNSVGSAVAHATEFSRVGLNAFARIANPISTYAGAFEWFQHTFAVPDTLTTGSDPGAGIIIAPGAAAQDVDLFTLRTGSGTETITSVTVNLSTNNGVGTLAITDNANTVLGSIGGGTGAGIVTGSNTISVSGMSSISGSATTFKVRVTPLSHANMLTPDGADYSITAPVTSWAGDYANHVGSDTNPNVLTIDNNSPAGTTGANATAGDAQADVSWTPPIDGDFDRVFIYCKTSSMVGGEAPTEGTDPTVDGTACDGTARLKYKGAASPQTIAGLSNGTLYYFRIYARDLNGNFTAYSATEQISATPALQGPDATSYANTETALDFANCGTTGCGGRIGQQITITGTNFGTPANKDVCTSGATNGCVRIANYTVPAANISSWIATQIVFTIPSGITVYGGSGTICGGADGNGICVTQNANNDPSGALEFFVFPDITSTTPGAATGAKEGDSITVSGTRFGGAGGTLVFQNCAGGDVDATPTGGNWTDTSLTVTVPTGIANDDDSCDIKITRAAGTGSKTDSLTGFVILPNITSVSTNAASARECVATDTDCNDTDTDGLIKLNGNHFGSSAGTVQFTGAFGSISATVHATVGGACDVGGWAAAATSVCIETSPTISDSVNVGDITLTRTGDSKTYNRTSYRIIPRITSITPSADGVNPDSRTVNGNHFCQSGSCLSAAAWNAAADDGDDVKFGTTNATVTGTPSDTAVAVTVPSLTPGNYSVTLSSNSGSSYTSNGKNFSYLDNTPANPSSLNQYQSNCSTAITDETTTTSSTVCLKGAVSGGITGGTLYLQVEVRASATGFTDATAESAGVSAPAGGTESVSVTPGQGTFKWRARTCHYNNVGTHNLTCTGTGDYPSALWVEFETGAVPINDFTIDSNGPAISGVTVGSIGEFTATISWTTDENATSQVDYGKAGYIFTVPKTDYTSPASTNHSIVVDKFLTCGQTGYQFRVRSKDGLGQETTCTGGVASGCQTFTNTFNTLSCTNRIMRSAEYIATQTSQFSSPYTNPVISTANSNGAFDVYIEEASPTIRSAFVEITGVSSGSAALTLTAQVNAAPSKAFLLPISTTPQPFKILYEVPPANVNVKNSGGGSANDLQISLSGPSSVSLIRAKMYVTYHYAP